MEGVRTSRQMMAGIAGAPGCDRPAARARKPLAALMTTVILLLGCARLAAAATPESGYRFGVFPYLPALTIDELFGPLAARFARDLERPVQLRTKSTFELYAKELSEESYDLVLVHPFFYVDAADRYHYLPLARVDADLIAVVLVGADRPWHDWQDLAGRTLALPPALSAVSEMVGVALRARGLAPDVDVTLRHYASKVSCLHAVVLGAADGCAVPGFIASQIEEVAEMNLRVMAETPPINHFVVAVHQRVAPAHRATLLQSLLSLPGTDDGKAILAATNWPRFVVAQDDEYDTVRHYRARQRTLAQR
jgi:ABC-type phosphate/phosphonate transport system substrate-binding protein